MREDIQCLRGIAITFVFLYHLFPTLFVNGFLGVDMFFVISGFLMAKNLTNHPISKVCDILQFYYKRFKRIFPLYYLVILVFVVLIHFYLGDFYWRTNRRYSLASLFLITNQLIIHDSQDYFSEFLLDGSSKNAFLHLWSLSVEMQFYLLVPFIFFALQRLKNDTLRLIAVSILTVAVLIPFTQINAQFAFNFMFLRLWQFSAGFVAFYWTEVYSRIQNAQLSKLEKEECSAKSARDDLVTTCLVFISFSLAPYTINPLVLRPLVTFSTAVIIAIGDQRNQVLKSKYLLYLGDISYAFYLIHWPVICLFLGTTLRSYVFCVLTTFTSSILAHHLFEKVYLKLGKLPVIALILSLIACNDILQYSVREHRFWEQRFPAELQKIVDENRGFAIPKFAEHPFKENCTEYDYETQIDPMIKPFLFRHCHLEKGIGNMSISVIGNSYSLNLVGSVQEHFGKNYSEFRYLGIGGTNALHSQFEGSQKILSFFQQHVETYKPDVLIVISRHTVDMRREIKENDGVIREIEQNIALYEKFCKQVYILGSHPLYNLNFLSSFLHYATQKPDEVESLHLDKKEADHYMRNSIKRFKKIKCRKCHVFELSSPFVENGKYLAFDKEEMVSFVDNGIHFTPPGVEKMGPAIEKLTKDVMTNFQ